MSRPPSHPTCHHCPAVFPGTYAGAFAAGWKRTGNNPKRFRCVDCRAKRLRYQRTAPYQRPVTGNPAEGAWLRAIRQAANVTLEQAATLCGVTDGYLSLIETGKRRASEDVVAMYRERFDATGDDAPPSVPLPARVVRKPMVMGLSDREVRARLARLRGAPAPPPPSFGVMVIYE